MTTSVQANLETNDDLSLYGLFSLFISNWLTLVITGFLSAILALIWAINQPNIYEVETILMPVENKQGGLGGLAGEFGGLASLAGMNLSDGGDKNSKLALELMESRYFIMKFIEHYDLTVPLMAVKSWDIQTDTLLINDDIYDAKANKWLRQVKAPKQPKPSALETYEVFKGVLNIEQDPKTKFIKLSIEYYSPFIAQQWARNFVAMINEEIRQQDSKEADESIAYLKELIQSSYVAELKKAFTSLMEEQLKSKMLAEVRKDYVFKVVDPALAPESKSKPKRALIIIAAGFLGGIIGIIIILYRSGRKSAK